MRYLALPVIFAVAGLAQPEPQTAEEFYAHAQQAMAQKQMDRVVEDCTQAIIHEPDFHEALLLRATAYSNLKQHDRAAGDLEAVIRMHPRASTYAFLGNQQMLLKNYEAARAAFSEAIRRLPSGSAAYELRAN